MIVKVLERIELEELLGTGFEKYIRIFNLKKEEHYFLSEDETFELVYIVEGKVKFTTSSLDGIEYFHILNKDEFEGLNFALCDLKKLTEKKRFDLEILALEDSVIAHIPLKKIFQLDFKRKPKLLEKLLIKVATINADRYKEFVYRFKKKDEKIILDFLYKNPNRFFTCQEISLELNIILRTVQKLVKNLKEKKILKSDKRKFKVINKLKLLNFNKRWLKFKIKSFFKMTLI